MSGGRLPKRIVFGNLEGAVRRGRGGKENKALVGEVGGEGVWGGGVASGEFLKKKR